MMFGEGCKNILLVILRYIEKELWSDYLVYLVQILNSSFMVIVIRGPVDLKHMAPMNAFHLQP